MRTGARRTLEEEAEALASIVTEGVEDQQERAKLRGWYAVAYRVALRSIPRAEAEDIVQETVLELVLRERRQGIQAGAGLAYLVAKSMVHSYYDSLRQHRIGDRCYRREAAEVDVNEAGPEAEEDFGRLEDLLAAQQVLASLPVHVAAIVLRYVDGGKLDGKERMVLTRMRRRVLQALSA